MKGHNNVGFEDDNNSTVVGLTLETISEIPRTDLPNVKTGSSDSNDKSSASESIKERIRCVLDENKKVIKTSYTAIINILFGVYFAWATYHYFDLKNNGIKVTDDASQINGTKPNEYCKGYCGIQWCDGYGMLLILTILTYLGLLYYNVFKPKYGRDFSEAYLKPIEGHLSNIFRSRTVILGLLCVIVIAVSLYLFYDTMDSRERLRSLIGVVVLYGIGFVFSKHMSQINWRPVICGIIFQFLLGVFCIRMKFGRNIFECIGGKVAQFLDYSQVGSEFVYGKFLVRTEGVFAFAILPVIFFFSFFVSILYYWGAMQWFVQKLGWILQSILGTTVCESVTAAGNIFLGMTESPLLIKPYIKYLTTSEIHAIMGSGFATVSGTVLAAYISYGAEPAHLITSSVMAAPATLAFSKLFYPETEESKTTSKNISLEKSKDTSVLDAASNGAMIAINLILGIIANLVAFVSFMAFLNGVVGWLGYLIGYDYLSFEWIFAKAFIPLAYIMGIPWDDCENVGKIIATKTMINEFVAYERLGKMKAEGLITLRSSAIATFAVCGFANPSSLGVMIGSLSALAPEKRSIIASLSLRAFVTGSFVCFINASIAGLLMTEDIFNAVGGS